VAASCTVVVCTRDRPAELERCLDGLARLDASPAEILLVHSVPCDAYAEKSAARHNLRCLIEPLPGVSHARNRGARAVETEFVAFLDDDSVPEPQWLSALLDEFADPRVMAVTGHARGLGAETDLERALARTAGAEFGGPERLVFDRENADWFFAANFGVIGIGMNMAFRRRVFDEGLAFDVRLGRGTHLYGCEEPRIFFELIKSGHRIVYTPRSVVLHPFPATLDGVRMRHLKALEASGAYAAMVLVEEPGYRGRLLRVLWRALRPDARRPERAVRRELLRVPRLRELRAYSRGAGRYLRTRWRSSPST
jgi:cellulose synthase/poly-beta-1,6-N-acetylglucosamine synthase-like glycosyltransferase